MPDYAILSADGSTRVAAIVAESEALARELFPAHVIVPRGAPADRAAQLAPARGARIVSRLALLERFSDAELGAILAARAANRALDVWITRLEMAGEVDLDSPLFARGLAAIEGAGLLAAGRAAEIRA